MAKVTVANSTLTIEISGFDKLWSLKSRLEIPLAHVRGATADPGRPLPGRLARAGQLRGHIDGDALPPGPSRGRQIAPPNQLPRANRTDPGVSQWCRSAPPIGWLAR